MSCKQEKKTMNGAEPLSEEVFDLVFEDSPDTDISGTESESSYESSDDEQYELSRPSSPVQGTPEQAAPSTVPSGETTDTLTSSSEKGVTSTFPLEVASQTDSEEEYLPSKRTRRQPPKRTRPAPSSTQSVSTLAAQEVTAVEPREATPKSKRERRRSLPAPTAPVPAVLASSDRWKNSNEEDTPPDPHRFVPVRQPGPVLDQTASWTVLQLFQLFFSSATVNTIIANTNANAERRKLDGKKYKWTMLTVKEFYLFLAIIVYTGLVRAHHRSDFWKTAFPYDHPFPKNKMTRDRFEAIIWSLHLSNPKEDEENELQRNTPNFDRLFRIKPLYTEIVTACQSFYHPRRNICIDERMVASKARIGMKQYHKAKPTKWGYKLFVLADSSNGYTWNFWVYTGKSNPTSEHGLSYTSVMDLMPFSALGLGYTLFVDNFYTSPALFKDLTKNKIGACGTIRKTQSGFPKTSVNDMPKNAAKGEVRWIREDELLFVKWMDKREVTMCSSVHAAFSGKTVKRKEKQQGVWQKTQVPCPDAIVDYNKHMGGVDLSDALIGYYTVLHKTMKWYKTFFYHFMDIAIVNAHILHKEVMETKGDGTKPYTQKEFRETLVVEMVAFAADSEEEQREEPATCMPLYYGVDATSSRKHCRRCFDAGDKRVKTPICCRKCKVPLCLTSKKNCFAAWHDAQ